MRTSPRYMHISVDDVIGWLEELSTGGYESVWDHPAFAFLKDMHDRYGAVFSLYCFYASRTWDLSAMTTAYKREFQAARGWLRFGFHGHDAGVDYGSGDITGDAAGAHYAMTVDAIRSFAGAKCLDTVPRVHFFAGTLECVRAWRDADDGIVGLLSADDSRRPYYLSEAQRLALVAGDDLYDDAEDLYLVRTDLRLENVADPAGALDAMVSPLGAGVEDRVSLEGQHELLCVFTHEDHFDAAMRTKIEDVCSWAKANDYAFGFPMDDPLAS